MMKIKNKPLTFSSKILVIMALVCIFDIAENQAAPLDFEKTTKSLVTAYVTSNKEAPERIQNIITALNHICDYIPTRGAIDSIKESFTQQLTSKNESAITKNDDRKLLKFYIDSIKNMTAPEDGKEMDENVAFSMILFSGKVALKERDKSSNKHSENTKESNGTFKKSIILEILNFLKTPSGTKNIPLIDLMYEKGNEPYTSLIQYSTKLD